jgi:hypothetical protein
MSASNETTQPSPRMSIVADATPAAPWTGVKFTCEKCQAVFQLEAADECQLRAVVSDTLASYDAPACWSCGHVNVIEAAPPNEPLQGAS